MTRIFQQVMVGIAAHHGKNSFGDTGVPGGIAVVVPVAGVQIIRAETVVGPGHAVFLRESLPGRIDGNDDTFAIEQGDVGGQGVEDRSLECQLAWVGCC